MKKSTKQKLIYIRYILPPILMLLVFFAMLIPSYRYVAGGEINDTLSGLSLLNNSYDQAREVLFGDGEKTNANLLFARILLAIVIICPVLYLVAFAAALYCAVIAMRYFMSDDEEKTERSRMLFITFFPNRICLCIAEALMLPTLLIPYAMNPIYKGIFNMNVSLILTAPDGLIFGAVALLAIFVLSAVCAPMEREFDADIFNKHYENSVKEETEAEEESDYKPVFSTSSESESEKAERNERIRQLLKKEDE